jgi:hypothetical protein
VARTIATVNQNFLPHRIVQVRVTSSLLPSFPSVPPDSPISVDEIRYHGDSQNIRRLDRP